MTQRFLVYPLIFVALLQLVPLLRRNPGWFAAQITQLGLILLASLGAIWFVEEFVWVLLAWSLFAGFVVAPRALLHFAVLNELQAAWLRAARLRRWAARLSWGRLGRLYLDYAGILQRAASGDHTGAESRLDALCLQPLPAPVRGVVRIWKLSLLVAWRQWDRAAAFYDSVEQWGTLGSATQARLLVARAFAETGGFDRALRCLQFVAMSPRALGAKLLQLRTARISVAALAGDREELERLLAQRPGLGHMRGFARFAAYWRGRCALARGEREEALRQLARAFALTDPRSHAWRQAIQRHMHRAEAGELPASYAAQSEPYLHGRQLLHHADQQAAGWRALMQFGRPAPATLTLLLLLGLSHLLAVIAWGRHAQETLWLWAGNGAEAIRHGQYWRVVTAMFLHANLLHLAMNGAGLWIFGSAVERTMGRWRFLLVFFLAGAAGNFLSAAAARYDIAVGASAGIFASVAAFAVAVWRLQPAMYAGLRRQLLLLLALLVTADFVIGGYEPMVDNLAHIGGFAAGLLLAAALHPRQR